MTSLIGNLEDEKISGKISSDELLYGKLSSQDSLIGIISDNESIKGIISDSISLKGILSDDGSLTGKLEIVTTEIVTSDAEEYTGSYTITPSTENEKILLTKNKFLNNDITVNKVPYFETSNTEGTTVYIGSEV